MKKQYFVLPIALAFLQVFRLRLFLYLHIENRRVVIFFETLVGVVLTWLVVVLEKNQGHFFEWNRLAVVAVFYDVFFG